MNSYNLQYRGVNYYSRLFERSLYPCKIVGLTAVNIFVFLAQGLSFINNVVTIPATLRKYFKASVKTIASTTPENLNSPVTLMIPVKSIRPYNFKHNQFLKRVLGWQLLITRATAVASHTCTSYLQRAKSVLYLPQPPTLLLYKKIMGNMLLYKKYN